MPSALIRILLVEDDELFRLGISTRINQETGLQITAEAEDGETAIALVKQQVFDVVILDVGLPGIGGIEACRQIKLASPKLPVLVFTSHSQPALIARLIEVQAQGYCVKGIAAEALVLAIRSVAAGASWWDAIASVEIQAAFQAKDLSSITPSLQENQNTLTKREEEILSLVAKGKSNQEIADTLYIAPGTVRVHVHAILKKLDVRDRTQAAILALQKGLISRAVTTDKN
ncbi:MAG: response regulator transcription factor [Gomphosphaeria aponina SAG 52.96 = DSM 107014]|uniref:Response regulator transcription factor n=1 Tax=Gomphosphaeria aponina SAG 52.96 = DSM 107014 TaxID=1521640 RepID=A0A941GW07_9CHRO|nr:response regulator transcription factor [Gomphosphaeria aponina SAG 52.96 = DSM 107014]